MKAAKQAFAPPLSQLVPIPPPSSAPNEFSDDDDRMLMRSPRALNSIRDSVEDSVLQESQDTTVGAELSPLSTNAGLNILGIGYGFPGYTEQAVVPDANGAVGPTQFVQFVNESFVVFNKSNGSVAYGPADGNTLWQALGAPCSTNPNLDEIVQFDKLAKRWVVLMPVFINPDQLCVAVSTTSDATNGGWNLYDFSLPHNRMPDYPKLAVWPDAYYVTYNQGQNLVFVGAAACALNRSAMLAGTAATMQCFANISTSYGVLLPGDLDGATAPPAGSPEYFLNFDANDQSLDLWQFHVNWTTPSSSTFTGATNIPVAVFTEPCGETIVELNYTTGACIPQSGTTQMLDSYGDRLMYRLAYRNFGAYQSLVANHAVVTGTNGNQTGIRWYELRNTGTGFAQYQQGTYAPDSSYRWMGSIAMDKTGDIALGYSVSSSTMSPSIRYTGRVPTDPLGQMESEVDVLSSASVPHTSQTTTMRWGDYSSMVIDPTNDCTFWYTTQYHPTSASPHWATRIASFSFPSCTKAATPWSVVKKTSKGGDPITNLTIPATGTGHLIAVAMMFNGKTSVASVSDNATGGSNTYVSAGARATTSTWSTEIWYAVSSRPGATVLTPTFAGSPTSVQITVWEVSGVSSLSPDATNISSGSVTLNNIPGPAVTTTQAGDFIVSVLLANTADFTGITSGNEFTDDFTTLGNGWAHITSTSATAGTHQASWYTASPVGVYCASTVAFLSAQ
ncbi:MAG: hypothetical protein WBG09_19495 [Candidatus Sulfotelmatobacter sp.]